MKSFTVCSLVTDFDQYGAMRDSFVKAGFSEAQTDFLLIDNSQAMQMDAYEGLNYFLSSCTSEYIIVCHQDVRLNHDTREDLEDCLKELHSLDENWAIAGNAGGDSDFSSLYLRITDPLGSDKSKGPFPARVFSLDENFLIIRNGLNIAVSNDLNGFHFYGTDICLQAGYRGLSAYVINFHLEHLSAGNYDKHFFEQRKIFIEKHSRLHADLFIRTSCTHLYLTNSTLKKHLGNSRIFFHLKRYKDKVLNRSTNGYYRKR